MPFKIKNFCPVCNGERASLEDPVPSVCCICGEDFPRENECGNGHAVCYQCRHKKAREDMMAACLQSSETDPLKLALALMRLPFTAMHGPEHHFLVPASLLVAYHNSGKTIGQEQGLSLAQALDLAGLRSFDVPAGTCGLWGACGGAVGTGIFYSIATGTTPLSGPEWAVAGELTSLSIASVAKQGGPRCCKRDCFLSLQTAVAFANKNLGANFPSGTVKCEFFPNNKDCKGRACPFFPTNNRKKQT